MAGVYAVAGSRVISAPGSALVVQVASDLVSGGGSLMVGCCSGADAAVLSAVPGVIPPSLVRCLAAFGPNGSGSGPASAVAAVSSFASFGGSVQWWAGGSLSLPLMARLVARTRAVVRSADLGLVVFFSSPGSRGSLLACRCAIARGLPILAYPVGFSGSELAAPGPGFWVPAGSQGGFKWRSNQSEIFS